MRHLFPGLLVAALLGFEAGAAQAQAPSDAQLADFIASHDVHRGLRGHPDIPAPDRKDLMDALDGDIVVKKGDIDDEGLRFVWAAKVMDTDAVSLWLTLIDRERYDDMNDNIVESFISRRFEDRFLNYNALNAFMVAMRHQVLDARVNVHLYEASGGKLWEHHWSRVPDVDEQIEHALSQDRLHTLSRRDLEDAVVVPRNDGSWMLLQLPDGRTWAETYTINDPGGRIPEFVVRRVTSVATGRTFAAYESWAIERSRSVPSEGEDDLLLAPDGRFMARGTLISEFGGMPRLEPAVSAEPARVEP